MGLRKISAPPASSALLTTAGLGNVVYVGKNGADSSGQRNNIGKPFLTLAAAIAVAQVGDVIVVGPGTWTENVAWPQGVSSQGAGCEATHISGTLTITATATITPYTINFSDVHITGIVSMNFAAKSGGDVAVTLRDCLLDSATTFTRSIVGAYSLKIYNTRCGATVTANWDSARLYACQFGNFTFNASAGSEQIYIEACEIPVVTINGAGTDARITGCSITSALTFTDNFGGDVYTTGCEMTGTTINIAAGTWHEYGCTFRQALVTGASTTQRVSYQRTTKALYDPGTTVVTLPIPIGNANYVVCVETNTQTGGAAYNVLITAKTGTTFTINNTSGDAEELTFGIFYRG
jgi:hypothetical protein